MLKKNGFKTNSNRANPNKNSRKQQEQRPTEMANNYTTRNDRTIYKVIVNENKEYSLWKARFSAPTGWQSAGKTGTRKVCIEYIAEKWTTMPPENLRETVEAMMKKNGMD
jgi:MbtH protein